MTLTPETHAAQRHRFVSIPAVSRLLNVCTYGIVGLFKWMM